MSRQSGRHIPAECGNRQRIKTRSARSALQTFELDWWNLAHGDGNKPTVGKGYLQLPIYPSPFSQQNLWGGRVGTKNLLCVLSLLQRQTNELCLGLFRRLRRNVVISPTLTVHGAASSASAVPPTACYILMLQFAIAHNTQTQSLCLGASLILRSASLS